MFDTKIILEHNNNNNNTGTTRDIEIAFKRAASKELSMRDDIRHLVRSEFLLCIILVARVLYHLPSQSRERKHQNARRVGKGVVVIYYQDMLSCVNEFISHYVEPFLSRVQSECLSSIGLSIEPDVFRHDELYFSKGVSFFLEKYEIELKKLFETYVYFVLCVCVCSIIHHHHLQVRLVTS